MQIPNEIILQIASHIHASNAKTLSSLSQTSSSINTLLFPILYSNLDLTQQTLVYILNNPSENFKYVKSLTLSHIWSDFDIDHTKSIISLHFSDSPTSPTSGTSDVVFPNAKTLTLRDTIDTSLVFDPLPIMASLPKLLNVERLVFDVRQLSWRFRSMPALWPRLRTLEMYTRNWTIPFTVPGIHHIIHLIDLSPFSYNSTCPSDQQEYGDGSSKPDPEDGMAQRTRVVAILSWMRSSIESCAIHEQVQGKGMSTWEVRVKNGGKKEIEWAEKRVGEMLEMSGLDQENEGEGEGDKVGRVKIVVEG